MYQILVHLKVTDGWKSDRRSGKRGSGYFQLSSAADMRENGAAACERNKYNNRAAMRAGGLFTCSSHPAPSNSNFPFLTKRNVQKVAFSVL